MKGKENMNTGGTPNFDERTGVKIPRAKKEELKRLSPGVYRNAQGDLVSSSGKKLPRPQSQPSVAGSVMLPPMPPGLESIMANFGKGKTLSPQERAARGIDPRDPNQYGLMPDGTVFGTMMGWDKNPADGQRALTELALGQARMAADSMTPQIPRANSMSDLLRRRG